MKFKSDIEVQAGLKDSSGTAGTSGKILSSTGTGVAWVDDNPGITGSGTTNYVPKFTGASAIGNSLLYDNGTNVGIGTTTPAANLEVYASSATLRISDVGSASAIGEISSSLQFWASDPSVASGSNASRVRGSISTIFETATGSLNCLAFNVNDGTDVGLPERMRITSGGNVGIGTASPGGILDVNGATSIFRGQIAFTGTDGVADGIALNYVDGASADSVLNIRDNSNSANRVTFLQSGNVGIGTTTPPARLSVQQITANSEYARLGSSSSQDRWLSFSTFAVGGTNSVGHLINSLFSAGALAFGVNGEKMRITSGGNVGIATTNPLNTLSVAIPTATTGKGITLQSVGGTEFARFGVINPTIDNTSFIGSVSNNNFAIYANNAERMRITSGGNVGIGTTSPAAKLEILGSNSAAQFLISRSETPSQGFSIKAGAADTVFNSIEGSNIAYGSYIFNSTKGTDTQERMRITSGGNLLIGTTTDSGYKLNVNGDISLSNGSYYKVGSVNLVNDTQYIPKATTLGYFVNSLLYDDGTNVGIGTTSPTSKLHVDGNIYSSGYFNSNNIYLGKASALFTGGSANDGGLMVSGSNNLIFGNALTERMRITSGGNVGIGTISPSTKLNVQIGTASSFSSAGPNDNIRLSSGNTVPWMACDYNGSMAYYGAVNSALVKFAGYNYGTSTNVTMELGQGAIYIHPNNNVSINTATDAGYKLDVNGTSRFTGVGFGANGLNAYGANGGHGVYSVAGGSAGSGVYGYTTDSSSFGGTFQNTTSGVALRVLGNATVSGTVTASGGFFNSDMRLKDLIDYDYNVSDIKPITYLWKDGRDNKKHVGYSAQEVQKVMPDAVNEDADGMLSVNYIEVLVAKIAELENRIKQLEK